MMREGAPLPCPQALMLAPLPGGVVKRQKNGQSAGGLGGGAESL